MSRPFGVSLDTLYNTNSAPSGVVATPGPPIAPAAPVTGVPTVTAPEVTPPNVAIAPRENPYLPYNRPAGAVQYSATGRAYTAAPSQSTSPTSSTLSTFSKLFGSR